MLQSQRSFRQKVRLLALTIGLCVFAASGPAALHFRSASYFVIGLLFALSVLVGVVLAAANDTD